VLAQNDDFWPRLSCRIEGRTRTRVRAACFGGHLRGHRNRPSIPKSSGEASEADVFLIAATPKFAAQAIRKAHEIGWKPTSVSEQRFNLDFVGDGGRRAGSRHWHHFDGLRKGSDGPTWSEDRGVRDWRDFMAKYAPEGDIRDQNYVFGYNFAMALEHVLKAPETT